MIVLPPDKRATIANAEAALQRSFAQQRARMITDLARKLNLSPGMVREALKEHYAKERSRG